MDPMQWSYNVYAVLSSQSSQNKLAFTSRMFKPSLSTDVESINPTLKNYYNFNSLIDQNGILIIYLNRYRSKMNDFLVIISMYGHEIRYIICCMDIS
jgi:hypothetical protein